MCAFRTSTRLMRVVLVAAYALWCPAPLSAQSADTEPNRFPRLSPGATVWITDSVGREQKVELVEVAGDVVTAGAGDNIRRLRTTEIVRVRVRQSDSVLNGALIGAGVAVASGLGLCRTTEPWSNCRDDYGPMLRIGAIGAAIGIGIDALIRGRKTVYEAPGAPQVRAAPIAGTRGVGLQLSVLF